MKASRPRINRLEPLDARRLLAYSAYAQLVNQDDAISQYSSITGEGVTVAVIDTGVDYTHASLGGGFGAGKKVVAGYDFYSNDSDPMDESGHGTMVAGAIAAEPYTVSGVTYQGVAPDAKIVALRVGTESSIPYTNIEKALQWVISNYETYDISVVNLSLGSGNYTDAQTDSTLSNEFATLKSLGIFVIAASGNSNDSSNGPISQDGIAYPAADENVFAVAAVNSSDVITSWSQRGDELDFLAPGENLVLPKMGGGTDTESGTSFAAPYVAGTAALIKQALPSAKAGDIGSILQASGVNNRDGSGESGNTTTLQFSRLNILGALDLVSKRVATNDSPNLGKIYDTALDSQGVLHAAFFANGKLAYATRSVDGNWSSATIVDSSDNTGYYISIAVDGTGKAAISYFDAANTSLRYASFGGTTWSTTTVDSAKHVGSFTSLAFDIDGNAYIAYYKRSGGQLKLATLDRDANTWTKKIVDSSANVGVYASVDLAEVAFSGSGFTTYDTTVAIAYSDVTNGDLKYARLDLDDTTATWYVAVVDDLTGVANISLNLHAGPSTTGTQAQIAYQDTSNQDVKYAYRTPPDGVWAVETVVASGNNGASVALTFNLDDLPTVIYFNGTDRAVYQSTRESSGTWSKTRIATSSGYSSVAFNERSGDTLFLWLNRPKSVTYSEVLI